MRIFAGLAYFLGIFALVPGLPAQSTQGALTGRLLDARTGKSVAGGAVSIQSTLRTGQAQADDAGNYALFLLPPGTYRVRASAAGYQAQEIQQLELRVGGRLDVAFLLRPLSDVWERGLYRSTLLPESEAMLTFFGPDMDLTQSARLRRPRNESGDTEPGLSVVLDPREIRDLPLAGRDLYAALVTQPNVTADSGTGRGLGVSVSGLRPSAANYLLDGVEHNDSLVSGPLLPVAPEAMQEYRLTLNNYAPEYGRSAGLIANAITRQGSADSWHGVGYFNRRDDVLNANSFARNFEGLPRPGLTERQSGFSAGGPVKGLSAVSAALDWLENTGEGDPQTVVLPTRALLSFTAPGSRARDLLTRFPAPAFPGPANFPIAETRVTPPVSLSRWLGLIRADRELGRNARGFARYLLHRLDRPDFIWTPYPDFVTPLEQRTQALALGAEGSASARRVWEARLAISNGRIEWNRAKPEFPTLFDGLSGTLLPGSPAFYSFRNQSRQVEGLANYVGMTGSHVWKLGGGFLARNLSGYLTAGRDGLVVYNDILDFTLDLPNSRLEARALDLRSPPRYDDRWTNTQFHLYAQDAWRVRPRLTLSYGLRYESFGAPSGVYPADRNDLAVRLGFAWGLDRKSRTVIRGAYGVFHDRLFDNLWQNTRSNNFTLVQLPQLVDTGFPTRTRIDARLRTPSAQNFLLGVRRLVGESWALEANASGSWGQKLITTDLLNRGRMQNPAEHEIAYRANQGDSSYAALSLVAAYRGARGSARVAYTWSHAIDVQSEPLAGDFFNLTFTRLGSGDDTAPRAQFSRQGDPASDRGSADFDQRHNLVFYSTWDLPWRLRFSQIAAVRSGFPYSVFAGAGVRADLIAANYTADRAVPGGRQLLDARAFALPAIGSIGNTGRNAFRAPAFGSLDVSLSRGFTWRERWRFTARVDAYNVLNRVSLDTPGNFLGSPEFGVARYGRRGRSGGFPAIVPLNESPRNVQVILRVEF